MRKVIGIGETILDVIFKEGKPVEAIPGGSVFNALASLGRAHVPTVLVSKIGTDRVSDHIVSFMNDNGVDSSCLTRCTDTKSPVSLAFLDEHNDADYVFYRDASTDVVELSCPDIERDDIVLIGSYFAVDPQLHSQVQPLLERARECGAIIYYDVNYRPSHRNDVIRATPNLLENYDLADIVRGSRDDFDTLYRIQEADKVYRSEISFYCKRFVYTDSAHPVQLFAENGWKKSYPVAAAQTVSTIGAGDNFNAGFIYGLLQQGITRADLERGLNEAQWDALVASALRFSAACCMDIYNYVSRDFAEKL